ncbi:MAG: 4-hydroxy-tetrahydrodipicolinate reductase [Cyclobacteriaceae bacterium]|nr:4-hydroxy-tetrahydrodipicolinate reductase [Cyclobacteriaceae bacterium]
MKILLLGYGKMGKTIERLALERNHTTIAVDNRKEREGIEDPATIDVAIEFSQPDAAKENILFCLENNIPVLSGTTGWLQHESEVKNLCEKRNGAFFYASNYSIGVNMFFKLNKWFAKKMDGIAGYNINMEEVHHTQKLDSPSGTAITLAEGIIEHYSRKNKWSEEESGDDIISITSKREGDVPGTHIIRYASEVDTIELKHTAHSRLGFAMGALLVAEWLPGNKGVLNMDDFLKM